MSRYFSIIILYSILHSCSSIKKVDNPPLPSLNEEEKQKPEVKVEQKTIEQKNNSVAVNSSEEELLQIVKVQQTTEEDQPSCVKDICFHMFPKSGIQDSKTTGAFFDKMNALFKSIDENILIQSSKGVVITGRLYGMSTINNDYPTWVMRFYNEEKAKFVDGEEYRFVQKEAKDSLKQFKFSDWVVFKYYAPRTTP